MANQSKKPAAPEAGDPLFNLKHAQVEAALSEQNGGLGPTTNVYISTDEDEALDEGPRDKQGNRRGEPGTDEIGSTAGRH
ncbi:hypothetical protein [Hymenobacter sp. BT730]|uniref:hypothetical protein n=1 Tax=Hymenobacter sp. BT730 TaxID=3063332 RepID=UPI0026E039DD|nr:hypothetical protein [Hymenobacter sp. BT730]